LCPRVPASVCEVACLEGVDGALARAQGGAMYGAALAALPDRTGRR